MGLPIGGEVIPGWVFLFDQGYLLCPVPVFQFFFAVDGVQDVGEVLVVDEAAYVVFGGVGSWSFFSVLLQAEVDVVGETYVETAGATGEDVDVKVVFALWHLGRITEVVAREKRIPPLRCGMTNKTADSSAALRNDKQDGVPEFGI